MLTRLMRMLSYFRSWGLKGGEPTELEEFTPAPATTPQTQAGEISSNLAPAYHSESGLKLKVVLIGIGGASCSGKTTLAKLLRSCIPHSFAIHQDDFFAPLDQVPYNAEYDLPDCDDAPTAILWSSMASEIAQIPKSGVLSDHSNAYSLDHLVEQKAFPIDAGIMEAWRSRFQVIQADAATEGEELVFAIVDGFLLYWDPRIYEAMDVRIFLRLPEATLKQRRHARFGYHTSEGELWHDPPLYWEKIVYPAYVKAHQDLFADGDVEKGNLSGKVDGLVMFEGLEMSMQDLFSGTCEQLAGLFDTPPTAGNVDQLS